MSVNSAAPDQPLGSSFALPPIGSPPSADVSTSSSTALLSPFPFVPLRFACVRLGGRLFGKDQELFAILDFQLATLTLEVGLICKVGLQTVCICFTIFKFIVFMLAQFCFDSDSEEFKIAALKELKPLDPSKHCICEVSFSRFVCASELCNVFISGIKQQQKTQRKYFSHNFSNSFLTTTDLALRFDSPEDSIRFYFAIEALHASILAKSAKSSSISSESSSSSQLVSLTHLLPTQLNIFITTWNLAGKTPSDSFENWLPEADSEHDIVTVGMPICVCLFQMIFCFKFILLSSFVSLQVSKSVFTVIR
jgi:hypothetical protein